MAATSSRIDELVQSVSLHNPRKWVFNGYILPFMMLQSLWIYCWIFIYGIDEYYDAGLVGIAAIGVLQIFLCLCCQWSVHIHTFLNCSTVSEWQMFNLFKYWARGFWCGPNMSRNVSHNRSSASWIT